MEKDPAEGIRGPTMAHLIRRMFASDQAKKKLEAEQADERVRLRNRIVVLENALRRLGVDPNTLGK